MDIPLNTLEGLRLSYVIPSLVTHRGSEALRLVLTPDAPTIPDDPKFAMIEGLDFKDGTIGVEVAGQTLPDAFSEARGFIGITFRIAEDLSCFEGIYLRPKNGRAANQLQRNRSCQYFSYPDYRFDRLREEAPGEYEAYVDLVAGDWTKMRIEVNGDKARLYVHDADQPTLLVNDLKLGPNAKGAIGLFIDNGSEGFFRNLHITHK